MKLNDIIRAKVLALVLTIASLAAGQAVLAMSTFTVSNPTGSTFRITRTGNTAVSETIDWRVVSLSAIAGVHFTGVSGQYSGTATFNAGDSHVDVTISESSPGENAYKYQTSSSRSYRFEVLDKDGSILASCDRSRDYGTQFTDTYLNKSITGLTYFDKNSGNFLSGTTHYLDVAHSGSAGTWVKVNHDGYNQAVHTVTTGTLYNNNNDLRNYLNSNSVKMYATVYFTQKEEDDGYQYIQILADNVSTYDGNDPNGAVNTPSTSLYKACFILSYNPSGSVETNPHTQFFPHRWDYADRNAQYSGNSWSWQEFDYDNAHLYQQAFKNDSYRAENSGSLVLSPTVNSLNIRFDAAGSSEDDWYFKDLKVRLALVDATAPTVLDNYKVSGGRHQKGNTIYVSVPFSEIVTVTGTPTLSTSWGTLNYYAGSGSNVLTFSGTISNDATGTLSVTGYSGISDLAGNALSGSISKDFDTTLDADYVWSLSDFNTLSDGSYEIASKTDLHRLAQIVNGNYNNCSGLTFRQTQNITCDNTYIPIGGYYSGEKPFRGTYDGQGHTVSGITVSRTGNTNADGYMGIFGCIGEGSTVQNVVLASSTFTGKSNVGGIVGDNYQGTVQNCRVESTVTIKAGHNSAYYHGGIVGYSLGSGAKVIGCVSAATVSPNGKSYCQLYGGIVGYQGNSTIKDCLYTGTSVDAANYKGAIVGYKDNGTLTNNYYTSISLGGVGSENSNADQNGARRARTVTLGTGVTLSGAQTTYNVSGLTAIGTTALQSGSTIYSGEGQTLTLSYSGDVPTFYKVTYSVNGSPIAGNSFTMPAGNANVTAAVVPDFATYWHADADHDGTTAERAYIITTTAGLDLLAAEVNSGNHYSDTYFKLGADLTYSYAGLGATESNYTAIGGYYNGFKGIFDGDGFTVSGIRIYKGGTTNEDNYQGLFGMVNDGTIRNVTLSDAVITGKQYVGGIAGYITRSSKSSTIENCHVTSSVTIHAVADYAYEHGGIVGRVNGGSVSNCTSAATLSMADGLTACRSYGGIVGDLNGTVQNCLVSGATISGTDFVGAIVGYKSSGTLSNNYYNGCTVNGTATGVGCGREPGNESPHDITTDDGAVCVFTLTLADGVTATPTPTFTYSSTRYYKAGTSVTLSYSGEVPTGYIITYSVNGSPIDGNTFEMPAANANVTAAVVPDAATYWGADADHDGTTAERAYIITTTAGLDLLAAEVNNSGNTYNFSDTYFKLGNDLTYSYAGLGATESNYTAIGGYYNGYRSFSGTFDGDGHTISGIRIYKGGTTNEDNYQGLFGMVDDGTIRNVTLSDAVITGNQNVGGIAGYITRSSKGSTIENCHVTSSVTIHSIADYAYYHGGIVGDVNGGSVSNCLVSGATISGTSNVGAIVGSLNGTVQNCLVSGATISGTSNVGAIVGYKSSGTLTNNYYSGCTVNGATTNVGTHSGDITTNDGAVCVFTLTLGSGVTATPTPAVTDTRYYKAGTEVSLSYSALEGYTFNDNYIVKDAQDNDVTLTGNTFEMPASNVTAKADLTAIPWTGSGTEGDPYIILYCSQLDLLASRVNSGTTYSGKYIKLGADITYDGTENNYTAIGTSSNRFLGTFDGDGHTVSGININRNNNYQGLFGYVNNGTVKNVTLANSTITGHNNVGGIVGRLDNGTVQNCRVESTVTIYADATSANNHGGIAGSIINSSTVDGCFSSATVIHNGHSSCSYFGAIAGDNTSSTIQNCLALGATVSAYSNRGVIAGISSNTLANNYYYNCTVSSKTTNIGKGSGIDTSDVSTNDGAVEVSAVLSETETVPTELSGTVAFRREFTGGKASTVCLPFAHEKGTEGTYYTFGGVAYDDVEGKWTATMNEYTGATLLANTPYLFVPAGSEAHAPVLFHGTASYSAAGTTDVTDWSFVGTYAQKTWTAGDVGRDYGFAATSGKAVDGVTDVQAGDFVKLAAGAFIRPMRAYLTYSGEGNPWQTANAPAHRAATGDMPDRISVLLVSSNGETTRIENGELRIENSGAWYSLNGQKLQGKPSAKGIYIHRGKKVAIR